MASLLWYYGSMLIYDVEPDFLEKYENGLRNKISEVSSRFMDFDSLNAKSLSDLILHADDRLHELRTAKAFLADSDNYLKPYIFDSTNLGNSINNKIYTAKHYEMDAMFVTDMINMGHFKVPKSYQIGDDSFYALRGAGSLWDIFHCVSRNMKKYPELRKNKFVVNIQESSDWELLALIGHCNFLYDLEPMKLDVSFTKDFRPLSKYSGSSLGSTRYGILDTEKETSLSDIGFFKESVKWARRGVSYYRQAHDSFLFFEILLVDDDYAGSGMNVGEASTGEWGSSPGLSLMQ